MAGRTALLLYLQLETFVPFGFLPFDNVTHMVCDAFIVSVQLKGKLKLSLCLTKHDALKTYPWLKHHATKTYWGLELQLHTFLTSALDCGEWSASRPCYPLDRRLGGPQRRSERRGEEKKIPSLHLLGIEPLSSNS
jgi:hypothetical protein